jgi:hypothetical protein
LTIWAACITRAWAAANEGLAARAILAAVARSSTSIRFNSSSAESGDAADTGADTLRIKTSRAPHHAEAESSFNRVRIMMLLFRSNNLG